MLPCLLTCSAVTSLGVLFVQVRAVADTGQAASTGPNAAHRRVVVTGMGVVSCLGHDVDTFYDNLLEVTHHTIYMLGSVEVLLHIYLYIASQLSRSGALELSKVLSAPVVMTVTEVAPEW